MVSADDDGDPRGLRPLPDFAPTQTLDRLGAIAPDAGEEGLEDLGTQLRPARTKDRAARAHRLDGYWRDVDSVPVYWQAHTRGGRHSAARLLNGSSAERSLLSGGTPVAAVVRGSVLSPGAVVEPGATVVDSVLLPGVRVCSGAMVTRAVLDDGN